MILPCPDQRRVTPSDIHAFEAEYGVVLPSSYRDFLMEFNGGTPDPAHYTWLNGVRSTYITGFHCLTNGRLAQALRRSGCDENLLPIAYTGTGNSYMLNLANGRIHFWDHETDENHAKPSELPVIADDILMIVDGLWGELDLPPGEIEDFARNGRPEGLSEFLTFYTINERNRFHRTVTLAAAFHGNLPLLKECVARAASLDGVMACAARSQNESVIRYLIGIGVDINQPDHRGRSPLFYARKPREWRRRLLELGACD